MMPPDAGAEVVRPPDPAFTPEAAPVTAAITAEAAVVTVALAPALAERLAELARRRAVPPEVVPVAALAVLARRYTGRPRVTLRGPEATYPLDLSEDRPVRELLASTAAARRPGTPRAVGGLGGGADDPELGLAARLDGPGWELDLTGCPEELAGAFAEDLTTLLGRMAGDPERSSADLLPESAYERRRPADLGRLHRTGGPVDADFDPLAAGTIPAAFAEQVRRHPDRPAVLAEDATLTYRQLAATAATTAAAITAAAAGPPGRGGQVALLCRHGAATVAGLLAALVTGRAYVPLDPTFPAERLAHILADSAAEVLLTDAEHAGRAEELRELAGRPELPIARLAAPAAGTDDPAALVAALATPAAPDDPAYLLYTSGSTGRPKGVVQSHRNVLFGVRNHVRNFALTPADRTSVLTSFGYDMAVTDTFGAILSGAAAVPVDIRTHGLGHLARALARNGVTVYHSTPTVYRYLCASLGTDGRLPGIRAVLLGGEEVTRHDVELARRHFAPEVVFVNGYGTTEISFAAQLHLPPEAPVERAVVAVGAPLAGIDVILADAAGRPTCLTGEVVVRSPYVALGYWGLPELTASRFGTRDGVRTYRTGDLARRRPDGSLVFLGRADRLVKIRGYRVELGEVEARLAALPGVAQAAVVARLRDAAAGGGDKEIVAYVVPTPAARVEPAALRAGLAAVLPDFMLPRAVVPVDALPIGVTGKLDVAALPPPPEPATGPTVARDAAAEPIAGDAAAEPAGGDATAGTGEAEPDPLLATVGGIFGEVLGLPRVDPARSFFDLGGHSLLLALVQQRLEAALGRPVPLVRLFEHSSVAALAAYLDADPERDGGGDAALARAAGRMRRRQGARSGVRR